ncbi:hypothetical protein [Corynebacterium aquilae]|uniref:SCP domain-containing protein n=1 Tax=Corynebacterium aquilae DSM 44791 TaxID=1431546 RepID=A0A1L7CFF2_9CORY|nr:hypothetical protein [Corynebacterium aquilae]APT84582.1 hypothetical protein CAQU_05340 [Corynebacterium aquilae DSM 44791]
MKRTGLIAALLTTSLLLPTHIAAADPSPTTGIELNVGTHNMVGEAVEYNPAEANTIGLASLKELRRTMWQANPKFQGNAYDHYPAGTRLRDAAAAAGITTLEQYLDVHTSEALNRIAIQRAFEASAHYDHVRPDGSSYTTAHFGTPIHYGESLAAGHNDLHSAITIGWGKGELKALNANGGRWAHNTGHLIQMIDPRNTYYGFGAVEVFGRDGKTYKGKRFAGLASRQQDIVLPETPDTGKQVVWMYRAPKTIGGQGESVTGLREGTPKIVRPAPITGGTTIPGSSGNLITILGAIATILSLLGAIASFAQQFAPR